MFQKGPTGDRLNRWFRRVCSPFSFLRQESAGLAAGKLTITCEALFEFCAESHWVISCMWSSGVGPGFTDVLRNLGGEVLKKVSENWKNPLDPTRLRTVCMHGPAACDARRFRFWGRFLGGLQERAV